jgi:AraC-like DNA-binding protein
VRWTRADIRAVGVLASGSFEGAPTSGAITFRPPRARLPLTIRDVQSCVAAGTEPAMVGRAPSQALAAAAKRCLDERCESTIRMAEVARSVGTSAATLSRVFKRELGLSPLLYRHHVQMMASIVALCRGKSIIDTAFDVGFSDLGRFYKQFRKLMKATPAAYRALGSAASRAASVARAH